MIIFSLDWLWVGFGSTHNSKNPPLNPWGLGYGYPHYPYYTRDPSLYYF
jgi:hypothetical protein